VVSRARRHGALRRQQVHVLGAASACRHCKRPARLRHAPAAGRGGGVGLPRAERGDGYEPRGGGEGCRRRRAGAAPRRLERGLALQPGAIEPHGRRARRHLYTGSPQQGGLHLHRGGALQCRRYRHRRRRAGRLRPPADRRRPPHHFHLCTLSVAIIGTLSLAVTLSLAATISLSLSLAVCISLPLYLAATSVSLPAAAAAAAALLSDVWREELHGGRARHAGRRARLLGLLRRAHPVGDGQHGQERGRRVPAGRRGVPAAVRAVRAGGHPPFAAAVAGRDRGRGRRPRGSHV